MGKHSKTWDAIQARPTRSSIRFADVESLLLHLGGEISEGKGSAITVELNGVVATFHRPHPEKEAHRYQVDDARDLLEEAGAERP